MFICDSCIKKKEKDGFDTYCRGGGKSQGACQWCGTVSSCWDVYSFEKKGEAPTMPIIPIIPKDEDEYEEDIRAAARRFGHPVPKRYGYRYI